MRPARAPPGIAIGIGIGIGIEIDPNPDADSGQELVERAFTARPLAADPPGYFSISRGSQVTVWGKKAMMTRPRSWRSTKGTMPR